MIFGLKLGFSLFFRFWLLTFLFYLFVFGFGFLTWVWLLMLNSDIELWLHTPKKNIWICFSFMEKHTKILQKPRDILWKAVSVEEHFWKYTQETSWNWYFISRAVERERLGEVTLILGWALEILLLDWELPFQRSAGYNVHMECTHLILYQRKP